MNPQSVSTMIALKIQTIASYMNPSERLYYDDTENTKITSCMNPSESLYNNGTENTKITLCMNPSEPRHKHDTENNKQFESNLILH